MFASKEGIPTSFVATELGRTDKAVYVYGHGAVDPKGSCCRCGRTLTHPGSILLGIGPECLGDWGARDLRLENVSKKDRAYMKSLIEERIVDCWIPKSIVKSKNKTEEGIDVPKDHKMLNRVQVKEQNKIASVKGNEFKITFPFTHETLTQVKKLEGRVYHGDDKPKYWTCTLNTVNTLALRGFGFELIGLKTKDFEKILFPKVVDEIKPIQVPSYKKVLFPFQETGVGFIEYKNGRVLVGDEMGLGKTIQALAWLQSHPKKRPVIIVCPASLKLNWAREIKEGMVGREAIVLQGSKPSATLPIFGNDILIINYDILDAWCLALKKLNPQVIIADEAHYFKSNSAKRTKAMKKLAKGVPHFIALTGTPIMNRPIEIYNAVTIIEPTLFPNFFQFAKRYCGAVHNGFGWDFGGATNTKELNEKLQTVMVRRLKKDVLKDLPDKLRSFIPFELDNQKEYDKAENNFIAYVKMAKGEEAAHIASNAETLAQIEALKQLAVQGKMKDSIEWIKNFLDTDGKLVVFAVHKVVINALMEVFGDVAVKIDGSVSMKNRDNVVQRFQNDDKVRLFVGNIKAAGVGLTLTAASNVAFLELPWTPGELVQAEDRCHRIGQEDSVTIYYLLTQGTIEEEIAMLLDSKRKVLDVVLDGQDTADDSLLSELMNKYL